MGLMQGPLYKKMTSSVTHSTVFQTYTFVNDPPQQLHQNRPTAGHSTFQYIVVIITLPDCSNTLISVY